MSMTTSVRIGPVRALGYGGQRAHDLREGKVPDYVDQERKHLNTGGFIPTIEEMHGYNEDAKFAAQEAAEVGWMAAKASGDQEAIKLAKAARNACRLKYDRNGVVAYRFILTFGREAQEVLKELDPAEVDRMAWAAMGRVASSLDTMFTGMSSHRDESAQHFHGFLRGVTNGGRKLNPDRVQCRQMQTVAAEPFKHLGIRRGKSKNMWIEEDADPSKYIHASVAELHALLPIELAAARQAVEEVRVKLDRVQAETAIVDLKKKMAEDEFEKLQERVSSLQKEVSMLEAIEAAWNRRIEEKESECRQLDADIEEKNKILDNLLEIVDSASEQRSIDDHMQHDLKSGARLGQKASAVPNYRGFPK